MEYMIPIHRLTVSALTTPEASWLTPRIPAKIHEGEIHIWRANLELEKKKILQLKNLLDKGENKRAEGYIFERDRKRFIARRGILRKILGMYLKTEPASLRFQENSFGKPYVKAQNEDSLCFNVSHSHELALYALAKAPVIGIDVECVDSIPDVDKLASATLSEHEMKIYEGLPRDKRHNALYDCWVIKEALVKAMGMGASIPLQMVSVSAEPGKMVQIRDTNDECEADQKFSCVLFSPSFGYSAALVVEGQNWSFEFYNFHEKE